MKKKLLPLIAIVITAPLVLAGCTSDKEPDVNNATSKGTTNNATPTTTGSTKPSEAPATPDPYGFKVTTWEELSETMQSEYDPKSITVPDQVKKKFPEFHDRLASDAGDILSMMQTQLSSLHYSRDGVKEMDLYPIREWLTDEAWEHVVDNMTKNTELSGASQLFLIAPGSGKTEVDGETWKLRYSKEDESPNILSFPVSKPKIVEEDGEVNYYQARRAVMLFTSEDGKENHVATYVKEYKLTLEPGVDTWVLADGNFINILGGETVFLKNVKKGEG